MYPYLYYSTLVKYVNIAMTKVLGEVLSTVTQLRTFEAGREDQLDVNILDDHSN